MWICSLLISGTPLLKPHHANGHTIHLLIKPFIASSFKDWLGSLLSCSGFEEKMDDAWVPSTNSLASSKEMKDIFDAEIFEISKVLMANILVLVVKKFDMSFLSALITSIPWVTNRLGRSLLA